MSPRAAIITGLIVAVLAGPASAQRKNWVDPYDKGIEAFKAQKWQAAIVSLEKAVAADPNVQDNKITDGVFSEPYFPYYYLFVAYLKLGELDKADTYRKKVASGPKLPKNLNAEFPGYQTELANDLEARRLQAQQALAAANNPQPPPANKEPPKPEPAKPEPVKPGEPPPPQPKTPETRVPERAAEPKAPEVDPRFGILLSQAETAFGAKQYVDAIGWYDSLKRLDSTEYNKRNLAAKRDEAVKAQALKAQNDLKNQQNQQLLDDARAKEKEKSKNRYTAGVASYSSSKYLDAVRELQDAIAADAGNGPAVQLLEKIQHYDKLKSNGMSLYRQDKLDDARQQLLDAQQIDTARFEGDGLRTVMADIDKKLQPPAAVVDRRPGPPIRDALIAYLKGDVQRTIDLLAPSASDQSIDRRVRADVHGYLGVAYADRSLVARNADDQRQLHQHALDEFRLAISARPNYQLSEGLISPRIRALLDEARTKK